jgi:uncharacterized protein (TIGR03437 family)
MNLNKLSAYFVCAASAFSLLAMSALAQQLPVDLGTASNYGVLAGSTVTNTGATVVSGGLDLGLSPGTAVTGFPPGTVSVPGTEQITTAAAAQAQTDLTTAYNDAAGRTATTLPNKELGGQTLVAGAYKSGSSFQITGTLTLDAQNDPSAVFIFQAASTLTTASGSQVKLVNGASPCHVFWQVGSSATIGTNSNFQGTIVASESITVTTGATVNGRLLAQTGAVTLDTNTIDLDCAVAPTGSITVVKNTVGGDGAFAFTSNFGLTTLATIGGTASQTFSGLTPGGSYRMSETVPLPSGWTLTSSSCDNGSPAAITVVAGATTTCTFTNTYVALPTTGSIKVVKNTVGGDGAFVFTSNFGLTTLATIGRTASQTFSGLTAGSSYSVSETVPSGWTQTSATCTNGTPAAITVVAGATTTCTFANTQQGASIKVVKIAVGGDGTFAFTSNFGLTSLTTIGGTASQTFSGLTPGGTYSLSETVPTGWTQTSATCTNGTPAAITIVAGATTTCTFLNTQQGASIRVVKNTVGGNGTFAFTSNFGLTSLTTVGLTASQTFSGLTPGGSYSVSETVPTGWTQTSATCTNGTPAAITVVAGATTTCTFLNTQATQTGSIRVVKNTVGGDGTFTFTGTLGLTSLTTIGGTASQTFSSLTPGSNFSVSETVPTGWTQTSASCTNGTPAAITVVAGATTTCTFINTKAASSTGSITVVKNTVGGNGTFAFTSNFGLKSLTTRGTTTTGSASQTLSGLLAGGSYSVSETVPAGWTQTSASCTNGTPAAITVAAGLTTTCTITNTMAATTMPDLTIIKSHTGDFRQGDAADTYTLTVTNVGQGPTTGVVTVSDMLPAGLTATAISGVGWSCTLTPLSCTRNDVLAPGASYPVITVTVSVATSAKDFASPAGSPAFQAGDILISMADGTVQWRRSDWTLVKVLTGQSAFDNSVDSGQAKGLAFDSSGDLYVTHWYGTVSSGNDVVEFDRNGNRIGLFGSGYNCNPSSIVFDNSGNAYVGQADCTTQILKFDPSGKLLAQYSVAIENRGTYHVVLDADQCTMYYTSEGLDVKRFNVCNNTQMSNFNNAPLPDTTNGAQQFTQLPGGGMLIADFSVIAELDASGNFVRAYGASSGSCWLGIALDSDGTSFWASDWCASFATRFDFATGNVIESHVISDTGFMVKQIAIPPNIFSTSATNTATVAGGGEVNTSNDSTADVTVIDPPRQATGPAGTATGLFNAASYASVVAAGSIASVFGSNLSSGQGTANTVPLPTTLASSSFQIGGLSAPLFFASPNQVNLQIPWELAGQLQASVTGTVGSVISMQQIVNMAPFAPGLFTFEAGSPQGVVMITGTQLLAASASGEARRPVAGGESITIYCTGLGAVSNQPATGFAAQASPLSATTTMPIVTIGGIMAQVSLSALVPGAVGLYQVNVQVPAGVPAGSAVPVVLRIGGVSSNAVTIAVQ